ncbi:MAG: metal ABC transporter ATP-binding protein [Planctomycetota bacterium]|jgi:ABC-type Mn2+/Zn2+ transport system ATPase subunit|nr:metal ABC transporter ATP-binding protein [Planctomycetota bacterium]
MSLLTLEQADLGYSTKVVLKGVSFSIAAGDFLVLAGANGSGKSTLLKSLIGALPLVSGNMSSPPGLRIGYVPQQLTLPGFFPVTVQDVVTMGTWRRSAGGSKLGRPEADAALALVGLEKRRTQSFAQLSGGQKQRALLARALVPNPQVLILDEPISGVDEAASKVILKILADKASAGVAVVMVTHQPFALAELASRALLVHEERVKEIPVAEMCGLEGVAKLWA